MQTELNFNNPKSDILEGLNDQQRKAVTHKKGPLLIIAGAGTGKTTVITRKIAYLIEQKIVKPSEILALTFTEKAAKEMEERVDRLVPYGFTDMWISTFHSFGDRLLRDYSLDLGLPNNFKVLTATEQAIFLRQHIYAFELNHYRPISNPLSHIEALLSHFSRLKDELISTSTYLEYANEQYGILSKNNDDKEKIVEGGKLLELANAYSKYSDLMIQAGNLDFGDQLFLTHKLLKENKKVLNLCHGKFKYLLVDEFQDTNYAQNEIVKLLAEKENNITVVGDDDQSIYRFRGASISNILDFTDTYKNATQIVLNKNYRSSKEILDVSYKLIQNNNPDRLEIKNKIDKRLISNKKGVEPELLFCETLSCEADTVVKKIKELKKLKNFSYNDFSILVRANNHAEPFIQSLNIAGIPHVFSGARGLFSNPEIKMLISFLKCLVYTNDNLAFYQLATSELYGVTHGEISIHYTRAKQENRAMINSYDNIADTGSGLIPVRDDIKKYSEKKNEPVGELLYEYLTEKNYLKNLVKNPSVENEHKINNVAKFFNRIAQFSHSSEEKDVLSFLNNLELILEVGEEVESSDIDPDIDAVNILTVHASKGLEWPVVFIVNCVSDRFPGRKKKEAISIPDDLIKERLPSGDFHTQEERRLFYVAVTRAKDYLFFTSANDYGGKRYKKLSPFVMEALDEVSPEKLKHKLSAIEKIERFKKVNFPMSAIPSKFKSETIRLSRQQIDDYYSCPKKFYFAHIIKIPLRENHYLMYGTAIHAALDHYFNRKIRGENLSKSQLITDFEMAFKNIGFISREQEELKKSAGIETLSKFFEADRNDKRIPSAVEEVFEFNENNVKINGRYDLVFGEGNDIEICDFKTSDVREQKEANKRIKVSTQMQIYALAWYEKHDFVPKTSLFFIESGIKGETVFKSEDLENTKQMIFEVAEGVKKNDMTAKPELRQCKLCPYRDICPESMA